MDLKEFFELLKNGRTPMTTEIEAAEADVLGLQKTARVLSALDAAGVDNWEYFDEALREAGIDEDGNDFDYGEEEDE